jgi:hypothetical protein
MKKAGREVWKTPCARRPWNPTLSASLRAGSSTPHGLDFVSSCSAQDDNVGVTVLCVRLTP